MAIARLAQQALIVMSTETASPSDALKINVSRSLTCAHRQLLMTLAFQMLKGMQRQAGQPLLFFRATRDGTSIHLSELATCFLTTPKNTLLAFKQAEVMKPFATLQRLNQF